MVNIKHIKPSSPITFMSKNHFDITLNYTYILLNYMRIQAPYTLTGIIHIYILLVR